MPEEPGTATLGGVQALFENLHRSLESVLAQDRLDVVQGLLPGWLGCRGFYRTFCTGTFQMRHDVNIDPCASGRVGERNAIMETQLEDARQTLNQ
ncbi:hypothetical protein D3C85_1379260 [compost metagenome]